MLLKGKPLQPLNIYHDFSFPGQAPMPFIHLAQRVLSICANSASCERLFSVFGATLTKTRNRLATATLTALGELKMRVRDDHLQRGTKARLKRRFAAPAPAPEPEPADNVQPEAGPSVIHVAIVDDGSDTPDTTSVFRTADPSPGEFRAIAERHARAVEEDDHDCEPVCRSATVGCPLKLTELFDFTRTHWTTMYEKGALRNFDEELELYELLDLDADGEDDTDVRVDGFTEDLLLG